MKGENRFLIYDSTCHSLAFLLPLSLSVQVNGSIAIHHARVDVDDTGLWLTTTCTKLLSRSHTLFLIIAQLTTEGRKGYFHPPGLVGYTTGIFWSQVYTKSSLAGLEVAVMRHLLVLPEKKFGRNYFCLWLSKQMCPVTEASKTSGPSDKECTSFFLMTLKSTHFAPWHTSRINQAGREIRHDLHLSLPPSSRTNVVYFLIDCG